MLKKLIRGFTDYSLEKRVLIVLGYTGMAFETVPNFV